ncbi:MAG: efflux RND transporter periplasmic adaptor subunit [Deltaproteobacteria bacterium]|nr:efflux RND transporter periplasmic adaptor subunit [Deltaproteobacteria bacterium]
MSETQGQTGRSGGRTGLLVVGAMGVVLFGALGKRFAEAKAEKAAIIAANAEQVAATSGPREVKVIRPAPGTWQPTVKLTGEVTPIKESSLGFKQPGRLGTVDVRLGDRVAQGQVLATLDPVDASAQAATAFAMVKGAELEVSIHEENVARTKRLFDEAAISKTEFRAAEQQLDGARVRLETAKAQAAGAGVLVSNTRLTSPFAGTVVQAPSAPGAVVMPGMPLFRVQDTSALRLSSSVHPSDVANVPLGSVVTLDGEKKLEGKVTVVFPSVDAQTRRVPIFAELPNDPSAPLLAGVFVRAHVTAPGEARVLKLPGAALKSGTQDEVWFVKGGKAAIAHIVLSTGDDGTLYVRDGLSEKDEVILAAGQTLNEGDAVRGTSISDGRTP